MAVAGSGRRAGAAGKAAQPARGKKSPKHEEAAEAEPADNGEREARSDAGSLQRGLAVLNAVIAAERPITLAEVSAAVDLSPSTVHRLLKSLSDLGYLRRDDGKRYYPSVRALFPAGLFHPLNGLRRVLIEQLSDLRRRFGIASSYIVFQGTERWVLETMHGHDALSPYDDMEVNVPMHATVTGKLLLSSLTRQERTALIGPAPYQRLTAATITSDEALDAELARVQELGYATALDEMLFGMSAVGAPVWCGPNRLTGALTLAGPSRNFEGARAEEMILAVRQVASLLTFASSDLRAVCRLFGC